MLPVRVSLIAITCAACGFDHGASSIGGNGPSDGGPDIDGSRIDAMPDAPPDARACWGTFVPMCFTTLPSGDLTLPGTIDTSSAATCTQIKPQTDGPELCVIAAQTIHVDGAWTLSPLAKAIASTLVLAGAFGLLTRAAARLSPWIGAHRYRVLAAAVPLAIGVALLALGAAELAWIWLVPAAAIAVLPAPIGALASLLPALLVLSPLQLREGVWNGFIPPSLPLSLLVAVIEVPFIASVAWMLRRRTPAGPLGTFVLGVGCGLAVIAGLSVAAVTEPACRPREFSTFGLACERV